jgi:hypothetical protein
MLQLNPGYKAPDDYKPILKETKIPLPVCAHNTAWCLFLVFEISSLVYHLYTRSWSYSHSCAKILFTLFRCRSTRFIIPIWDYLTFPMLPSRIMYHCLNCLWEQMCCLFIQFIYNKLLALPVIKSYPFLKRFNESLFRFWAFTLCCWLFQGKAHPGHSVIGVLLGPESNTQKRLQEVWSTHEYRIFYLAESSLKTVCLFRLLTSYMYVGNWSYNKSIWD